MLEAKLDKAENLKKVLDAVKELVTDANFDCSDEGIKLQAMDNSHVALVSLELYSSGFQHYRCDRNMSLGMSLASLQKIVKTAGNDDCLTLRADESADVLALVFENKSDRVGEYEMKLMDIDQEHLGIPDTVYDAEISLPALEFARIIRDLKEMGESVKIEVEKDGIRFSADGDIGSASVTLKPTEGGRKKKSDDEDEEEAEAEAEEEDVKEEDDDVIIEDASPSATAAEATQDEKPTEKEKKKARAVPDDENEDEDEEKPEPAEEEPEEEDEEEEEEEKGKKSKKRKGSAKLEKGGKGKKAKKGAGKAKEVKEPVKGVTINMQQAVSLTFSIKYLANFTKSTSLSDYVTLHMSNEVPLLVAYEFTEGHIRYYLAPKIADD